MNLLLDVGNSRIKWALDAPEGLQGVAAAPHGGNPAGIVAQLPASPVAQIALANVTGDVHGQALASGLQARYGVMPKVARVQASWDGLQVAYADASRLGVDRWLMMLALWDASRTAFGVAAAGTALTFDAVDGHGRHQGGLIAAGLRTHLQALLGATRFATGPLPLQPLQGLGKDTEACVMQGAFFACLGALDRAAAQAPAGARVLTGGDAELLLPELPGWQLRPHLVLEGLRAWLPRALASQA